MRLKELKNVKMNKTRKLRTKNKNTKKMKKMKKGGSESDQRAFDTIFKQEENTVGDAKMVFKIFGRSCKLNSHEYDKRTENIMNRNLNDAYVRDKTNLVKEFDYNYNLRMNYNNRLKKLGGLSDHRPLFFNDIKEFKYNKTLRNNLEKIYKNEQMPAIFTWNTLHHEGFNKEFFDPEQNDNFLTKGSADKFKIMNENQRYNSIANIIIDHINNKKFECISLQECEFSIYTKILKETSNCIDYYSRYYPRKIRLGKGDESKDKNFNKKDKQLDIKSYGNAIFVKREENKKIQTEALMNETDGDMIQDKYDKTLRYKIDIKVVKCKQGNNIYSSVHIPVIRNKPDPNDHRYKNNRSSYDKDLKKYNAALEFLKTELEFLFKDVGQMEDNDKLWLIGDFNLDEDVLIEELKKYSKNMVDFIFVKSGEWIPYRDPSAYKQEFDGSGSTPRDHIILCIKKPSYVRPPPGFSPRYQIS